MEESIVSSVIERVYDLLKNEAKFLQDVEGQVEDMQKELKRIQCFLKDADARKDGEEVVRNWVSEIRDIADDVEDVIETYILKVASPKQEAGRNYLKLLASYLTKCICVDIHKAGNEIVSIKSKISNLSTSMQTYGIRRLTEGERSSLYKKQQETKISYAHVEEVFVGMEDSIKDIVGKMVTSGTTHHRVVSICGMGGLGKTSLARKVYSHEEVRHNFDCFAWACVSQQYQVKEILIVILIKLIPDQREEISKMKEFELFEALYKAQQEKRCLVVLDDIWTKEAWDSLKNAFPMENTSSKILLTTRNRSIAEYVDPQCYVHELRCLSEKESWKLLKKNAFPGREDSSIPREMESLGKVMLRKCGGLPLAVIVLGGLLAKKKTLSEWETVQQNIDLDLHKGKIEVSKVLALSYEDLPYHLKPCFLYFANFPEDVTVSARKLIHMWIAEGFFPPTACGEGEATVEDIAEHSLNELVNRGLVQVRVSKSTGKIKTCLLHDVMRDLCILKGKEENFLNVINLQCVNEPVHSSPSTFKVRRMSIYLDGENGIEGYLPSLSLKLKETSRLRALLLFDPKGHGIKSWAPMQTLLLHHKLRLLDLEGFYSLGGAVPKSLGDLVHLRYLSLRNTRIEEIPVSLGNLECMETLDLRVICSQVLLPNVLWKMKRLRYLYLPPLFSVSGTEKVQLHSLRNLETLKNFCPGRCEFKDLEKLLNLQKLTFCPLQETEGLEQVLKLGKITFRCLRYTSFRIQGKFSESNLGQLSGYCHPCNLYLGGLIQKLPEDKQFPDRIRKLILKESNLEEDPMSKLGKLRNLIALHLLEDAFVGTDMTCSSQGFPQLKSLILCKLSLLSEWEVEEGALSCLSYLEIANCGRMIGVPKRGLISVARQQKLEIVYVDAGNRGRFQVVWEGEEWGYYRDDGVFLDEQKLREEWILSMHERIREALLVSEAATNFILRHSTTQTEKGEADWTGIDETEHVKEARASFASLSQNILANDAIVLEQDMSDKEEPDFPSSDDFNPREQGDLSLEPESKFKHAPGMVLARRAFRERLLPAINALRFISLLQAQCSFKHPRNFHKQTTDSQERTFDNYHFPVRRKRRAGLISLSWACFTG